ncbi:MAG: GNAT family N-acetyltransferase [Nitrosotalea sp.]
MHKIKAIDFVNEVEVYRLRSGLFNLNKFCCGKKSFDDYIKKDAFKDQEEKLGQTWLFVYKNKEIIGYVTIAMGDLNKTHHDKLRKLPHTNIPGMLLGQIATHIDYQKLGVGKWMIDWVIAQSLQLSETLGCRILLLDAENDVVDWYVKKLHFVHISLKGKNVMFYDLRKYFMDDKNSMNKGPSKMREKTKKARVMSAIKGSQNMTRLIPIPDKK